jgi:hypothetical protein
MAIKIKYKDPKSTDFGPNDLVINVKEGTIFYKAESKIFKFQGDNLNTSSDLVHYDATISALKGIFKRPGLGKLRVEGEGLFKFKVGPLASIEVGGHILPEDSTSPIYDLGSLTNPWRDVYISPNSLHFVKTALGVGASRIGTTFRIGKYQKETIPTEEETLTQENVVDLKAGKSISGSRDFTIEGKLKVAQGITLTAGGITGSLNATIDGGSF